MAIFTKKQLKQQINNRTNHYGKTFDGLEEFIINGKHVLVNEKGKVLKFKTSQGKTAEFSSISSIGNENAFFRICTINGDDFNKYYVVDKNHNVVLESERTDWGRSNAGEYFPIKKDNGNLTLVYVSHLGIKDLYCNATSFKFCNGFGKNVQLIMNENDKKYYYTPYHNDRRPIGNEVSNVLFDLDSANLIVLLQNGEKAIFNTNEQRCFEISKFNAKGNGDIIITLKNGEKAFYGLSGKHIEEQHFSNIEEFMQYYIITNLDGSKDLMNKDDHFILLTNIKNQPTTSNKLNEDILFVEMADEVGGFCMIDQHGKIHSERFLSPIVLADNNLESEKDCLLSLHAQLFSHRFSNECETAFEATVKQLNKIQSYQGVIELLNGEKAFISNDGKLAYWLSTELDSDSHLKYVLPAIAPSSEIEDVAILFDQNHVPLTMVEGVSRHELESLKNKLKTPADFLTLEDEMFINDNLIKCATHSVKETLKEGIENLSDSQLEIEIKNINEFITSINEKTATAKQNLQHKEAERNSQIQGIENAKNEVDKAFEDGIENQAE